ncbi:hypothetical protein L1D15_10040 [Vibrio sp. Isolate25]|uniref:hypothetical protein n=1 Tax=Vibrio sp. Isolate25 TaxID=2908535 RepID=UPI001EFD66E9|nr:hypothetical protein [Vibrio sp. Isolate25]MCG9597066.1 hypothetical protein [Vibrio sp. Isolate25]
MSRRSDPISGLAGLIAVVIVGGILYLSMTLKAPFKVTMISSFEVIFVSVLYGAYAFLFYVKDYSPYGWCRPGRLPRIWPLALTLIYWACISVIDQAGTVQYTGFLIEKKKFLFDTEPAWYSLWYWKVLISLFIAVGGQFFHLAIHKLWYRYLD